MKQWTIKLRRKEQFDVVFEHMSTITNRKSSGENNIDFSDKDPLPASTKHAPVSSAKKRKKSYLEMNNVKTTQKYSNQTPRTLNIPKGANFKKSCGLCRGKGHNRSKCDRLFADYQRYPLPLHDSKLRNDLVMSLVTRAINVSPILHRSMEDTRSIISEFPKKIKCLVIHKRFLKNQYIGNLFCFSIMCIECTLIRENYEIRDEEKCILLEPTIITKFILSLNSLVVSQM